MVLINISDLQLPLIKVLDLRNNESFFVSAEADPCGSHSRRIHTCRLVPITFWSNFAIYIILKGYSTVAGVGLSLGRAWVHDRFRYLRGA